MLQSSLTLKTRNYASCKPKILEKHKESLSAFKSCKIKEFDKQQCKIEEQKKADIQLKRLIRKKIIRKAANNRMKSKKAMEKAEKYLERIEAWENFVKKNNDKINEAENIFKMLLLKISEYEKRAFSWLNIIIDNQIYWDLFSQIEKIKTLRSKYDSKIKEKTKKLVPEYLKYIDNYLKKGLNDILAEEEVKNMIEATKKKASDKIKEAKIKFNYFKSIMKDKKCETDHFICEAKWFWRNKKKHLKEAELKMLEALEIF